MKVESNSNQSYQSDTLSYYNHNADNFVSNTINADMSEAQKRFATELPPQADVLDFGCGSGRDALVFSGMGFQVDAVDGSMEVCREAARLTGLPVRQMLFLELDAESAYDGIWTCASILHLPRKELAEVLGRIARALRPSGILYTSFKYGTEEGMRGGRWFTNFTEESLENFLQEIHGLRVFDLWITQDVCPGREEERWINLLARRI